ncbi:hypothetical protein [uncultured Acetatifactor sp.]|jgi:hypothetical protein|uniref:hypothetical protein n=1 Tax=uncultured Acetatifactor sp. TaxID=1671927 RepID=UPI00260868E0|nr:hypothetical protein [uncultured Acetatifactor sp.]
MGLAVRSAAPLVSGPQADMPASLSQGHGKVQGSGYGYHKGHKRHYRTAGVKEHGKPPFLMRL